MTSPIYHTRPERIRDLEAIIASLGWSPSEQDRRRKLQTQLHRLKDREADRIASIRWKLSNSLASSEDAD